MKNEYVCRRLHALRLRLTLSYLQNRRLKHFFEEYEFMFIGYSGISTRFRSPTDKTGAEKEFECIKRSTAPCRLTSKH